MIIGLIFYLLGLTLTLTKVYYDSTFVGFGDHRILTALIPDVLLLMSVLLSLALKAKKLGSILCVVSLMYFYAVLAFNGKGSAMLSCDATGWCEESVKIICSNLNQKEWSGVTYLLGSGIKIMATTHIATVMWERYKQNSVITAQETRVTEVKKE